MLVIAIISTERPAIAQQIVELAPDHKFDIAYWTALGAASLGVTLDAYTTIATIGPGNRCNAEVESPSLYGRVPAPARTVAVMGAQLGTAIFLSRELRRRSRRKNMRRLTLLLAASNAVHFAGAIHNERVCR
jgi:hypothetical protein